MKKLLIIFVAAIILLAGCGTKNMENNLPESNKRVEADRTLPNHEDLAKTYAEAVIKTSMGDITIKFYADLSPKTVNNFMNLAKDDFYNGILFHRVIPDFMIQAGDPFSKKDDWSIHGAGGPGYAFEDEFNEQKLVKGSVAMANSGPNTNGSQFFIITADATYWLDGMHTNFGYVTEGMDIIDAISLVDKNENNHPLEDVVINSIELK